ncbi:insulinase family protein, partial [Streptococcus gordonii]|nr:insulinase family protein [Streptococcus gordonii]
MQLPRVSSLDLMKQVTPETSFSVFQKMLKEDKIDIFFIGDFNEVAMHEQFSQFGFTDREQDLLLDYQQPFSKILREGIEQKEAN